jgi:CHASE2 domain-containing sensor protein
MEHHPVLCRRIAAALAWTHGTQRLDNQIYDRLIRWRAPAPDPRIEIVAMDDDSLKRLGAWPWRRDLHAKLIERLSHAGAALIAYDVLFIEPTPDDAALGDAIAHAPRPSHRCCFRRRAAMALRSMPWRRSLRSRRMRGSAMSIWPPMPTG